MLKSTYHKEGGKHMIDSKSWDWKNEKDTLWLTPCEESYYFCEKWKHEGRRSILDLGCGLGRHSILFAKKGFKVTSVDLSEYSISHLRDWEEREQLYIRSKVCDIKKLPFSDSAFDCIFSYHVVSHTDSDGIHQILDEIKRVIKPGGEIYLSLCSKDDWTFEDAGFPRIDENTVIKTYEGPEKGIPHFYVNLNDVRSLFADFNIQQIRHIDDCYNQGKIKHTMHYYITATYDKEAVKLDYSHIIGRKVSGKIDRPLGSRHPRFDKLIYPINYGYVEGVMAKDGDEQDVYLLGVDHPVSSYEGVVIAVLHRYNDIEDKWIVAPKGVNFTDREIMDQVYFQEKYFDVEIFR